MLSDAQLMAESPDYVSIGSLLKAHPQIDAGRRILYFEASNEGLDQTNEIVTAKALADSADFYKKYGNVDIDHYTQIGARLGIPDYPLFEIGRPLDVGQRGKATFVKSEIYSGTGPAAEKANMVWASMTELNPPQRWYPSVGGQVMKDHNTVEVAPGGDRKVIVNKVRWTNVGLSKTPVNQHVAGCATIPVGIFAKCLSATAAIGDLGLDIAKALTAGYGTDAAAATGGAALREQSLDHGVKSYFDFRNKLAAAMRAGEVAPDPRAADLIDHSAKTYGLSRGDAAEYVERFMRDLHSGLTKGKRQ